MKQDGTVTEDTVARGRIPLFLHKWADCPPVINMRNKLAASALRLCLGSQNGTGAGSMVRAHSASQA